MVFLKWLPGSEKVKRAAEYFSGGELALWGGSILLGGTGAFVFGLPVKAVFVLLMLDEFIKLPFAFWRYRTKVWLKDLTR